MSYDSLLMLDDEAKKFTYKAAGDISGGDLVKFSAGADALGSDISTYAWDDISVETCDDTDNCVGIALQAVSSGNEVAIAHTGMFILPAGSAIVSGGLPVRSAGYGNGMVNTLYPPAGSGVPIGRALSSATNQTGFALVRLDI